MQARQRGCESSWVWNVSNAVGQAVPDIASNVLLLGHHKTRQDMT